jgi:hypothetical protein
MITGAQQDAAGINTPLQRDVVEAIINHNDAKSQQVLNHDANEVSRGDPMVKAYAISSAVQYENDPDGSALFAALFVGGMGEMASKGGGITPEAATAVNAGNKEAAAETVPTKTAAATEQTSASETATGGPGSYSNLKDGPSVGADKPFTPAQKKKIYAQNSTQNGGAVKSDKSGTTTDPSQKSQKDVTPSPNEAQVDHIVPRAKGGTNSYSNAQVLTRKENRDKSDN